MAVTTDIIASWRRPRATIRRHLARGVSEAFAFTILLAFLTLAFVSQWPEASHEAFLANEPSAAPRLLARALAVLATIPLWYGVAALSRLLARAFGGRGSWYSARMALFWAMLAVSPLVLFHGLIRGFLGDGLQATVVGLLVLAGFLYLWLAMMIEAER